MTSKIDEKMNENIILFDWLSFSSKIDSVSSVLDLLGLSDCKINFEKTYGFYGYHDRLAWEGINIHFNPFKEDMGVLVEISGKGCRRFEESSSTNFMSLFATLFSDPENYNITRLDVAYDDHIGILPLNKIISDIHSFNFVSKFQARSFRIEEHAGHEGQTIYCGSQKSAVMFRIYDKKFERQRDDADCAVWNRFEIQLRGERASAFVSELVDGDSVGHLFFGVINNYLRFVKPDKSDSNKKRWKNRGYWNKFLQHCESISLYTAKNTEYNLLKCETYVHHQCSNAVECLINAKGVDKFLYDMIHDKPEYTEKYRQVSCNTGAILDFLRERGVS